MNGELWEFLRDCDEQEIEEVIQYLERLAQEVRAAFGEPRPAAPSGPEVQRDP